MKSIRNIGIIAHVDHGKTTLIDKILLQTGIINKNYITSDKLLDYNILEKERGITILAKCTSIIYKNIQYNFIDTPGHSDFTGEVEGVLSIIDAAIILVDAFEGPMPQTELLLSKVLMAKLKFIVVINKIDRSDRCEKKVINQIYDILIHLNASEKQLNFPILYASGKEGWASISIKKNNNDLTPLLNLIKTQVKKPSINKNICFSMLITILTNDSFYGKILIGKIYSNEIKINQNIKSLNTHGCFIEKINITKIFNFKGIEKIPINKATNGDIVGIAGANKTSVLSTICDKSINIPIKTIKIDPPTINIRFLTNNSPLSGQEGNKLTSEILLARLKKEHECNNAITLKISNNNKFFEVYGRGELQLAILIENMRREGFEFLVSKPKIKFKKQLNNKLYEPIEKLTIDINKKYSNKIINKLLLRKGNLIKIEIDDNLKSRLIFHIPSRSLVGYITEFKTDTQGKGIINRIFFQYQEYKGNIHLRKNGVLISNCFGKSTTYALTNLKNKSILFISAGFKVYPGMIIGQHNHKNDLNVNPVKQKQLTNIRTSNVDGNFKLSPHKTFTVEETLSFIEYNELIEITPKHIRLRKKNLHLYLKKNKKD